MSTEPVSIKPIQAVPYVFLFVGAPVFLAASWLARGVDWWLWVPGGLFAVSLAYLIAASLLVKKSVKFRYWYRALDRLAWFAMLTAIGGYLIRDAFALSTVHIENATPLGVRVMVDGERWIDLPARSTEKAPLVRGNHIITVITQEGSQKLDEHPAKVEDCGNYVLNIIGAEKFLLGEVVPGEKASEPRVIRAKWYDVTSVDYLFAAPPKELDGMTEGMRKTYFVRADPRPPKGR